MPDENGFSVGDIIKAAVVLTAAVYAQKALTPKQRGANAGVPTPVKQPIPGRWSAYGRARRMNPPYALYALTGAGAAVDVLLGHQGRMNRWTEYWLHDDKGAAVPNTAATTSEFGLDANGWVRNRIGSNGRYGVDPDKVRLLSTLGEDPATALSAIVDRFPDGEWTTDHRGDSIALLAKIANRGDSPGFARRYPNGDPLFTAAGEFQLYWDPRDEAQDRTDPDTWGWGENLALQLLSFLTVGEGGLGLDYETWIEPHIATWIAGADVCDQAVALAAGGTEPRYAGGGGYFHTDDPAQTIANLLLACDGKILPAADGGLKFFAGAYATPTVTLTDRDIVRAGTSLFALRPDDDRVNELQPQYTDPLHQWQVVDAPAVRDEDDIEATGELRSEPDARPWVLSASQAQRLSKAKSKRLNAAVFGQIATGLFGLTALGERFIRVQAPKLAAETGMPELADCVFEIEDATPDFQGLSVTFQVVAVESTLYDWDKDTDEQPATPPVDKPAEPSIDVPVITSADVVRDEAGVEVFLTVAVPTDVQGFDDLTWYLRYESGGVLSAEKPFTGLAAGTTVTLRSGQVAQTALEFEVAYALSDGRRSDWSEPFEVDSSPSGALRFNAPGNSAYLALI